MSFGGFGGFAEEESQDAGLASGKTPTRNTMVSAPGGDKKVRCVPITIYTALESSAAGGGGVDLPVVYEVQVKYVEVFGQIQSVEFDSSHFECTIDDGTGRINLKQYFEQPVDPEDSANPFYQFKYVFVSPRGCILFYPRVATFVRAVGALRTGKDPYVSINSIRAIASANEVAYHLLTTCSAHIDIIEEKDGTFGATPMRSFSYNKTPAGVTGFGSSNNYNSHQFTDSTPMKPQVHSGNTTQLTAAQVEEKVYQFLQSGRNTQWGYSKSDCVLKFKGAVAEQEINKAIDQLLDDARIYDTGDEQHFKSIE